ncbi:MAG TPA: PilT/PilU family type 4a pilus ATPase [Thermoanaerobaculia bacterium]|jgi:twitching motility protein PilT|nr:PilT/PilU family type 4a pilus ATPase [Thermoanaerobaculia bacterium]
MGRLTRDEELEQLVRELNQGDEPDVVMPATVQATSPAAPQAVPEGNPLERLLLEMTQRGASDLLLIAGNPAIVRLGGRLIRIDEQVLDGDDVAAYFAGFLTARLQEQLRENGAADFSLYLNRYRFRVNVHRQRGTLAAAIRALPTEVPTLSQLHLPASLADLVKPTRGLVLVCGPTGSGKTTTLASLVEIINHSEQRHIISIEDPVEYEHRNAKSVVEQIEIGRDAPSFAAALRAALRQDPDVILVGEMRDLETVSIALTAAETGHLILSTLHTSDAAQAIHRIIDVFPPQQQNQIRQQLALSLNAIVIQQLIPRADGSGRAVAVEVLMANQPVRNHIRSNKLQQFATEITMGKRQGMISFEDSLAALVRQGLITLDDARNRASSLEELESLLRA